MAGAAGGIAKCATGMALLTGGAVFPDFPGASDVPNGVFRRKILLAAGHTIAEGVVLLIAPRFRSDLLRWFRGYVIFPPTTARTSGPLRNFAQRVWSSMLARIVFTMEALSANACRAPSFSPRHPSARPSMPQLFHATSGA